MAESISRLKNQTHPQACGGFIRRVYKSEVMDLVHTCFGFCCMSVDGETGACFTKRGILEAEDDEIGCGSASPRAQSPILLRPLVLGATV